MDKKFFYILISISFLMNACGSNDNSDGSYSFTIQGGPPHSDQDSWTPFPPVGSADQISTLPGQNPEPASDSQSSEIIIIANPEPTVISSNTTQASSETAPASTSETIVPAPSESNASSTSDSSSSQPVSQDNSVQDTSSTTTADSSVASSTEESSTTSSEVISPVPADVVAVAPEPEPAPTTEIPVVVEPVLSPEEILFNLSDATASEKEKAHIVIKGLSVNVLDYTFTYHDYDGDGKYYEAGAVKVVPNIKNPGFALDLYKPWKYIFKYDPLTQKLVDQVSAGEQAIAKKEYATQLVKRLAMFHDDLANFFPLEKVFKYVTGLTLCIDVSCGSALRVNKRIYQGATPMRFHYNPYEYRNLYKSNSLDIPYREERLADIHEFGHFIVFNSADYGVDISGFKNISWSTYSSMTEKMKLLGITGNYSYPFSYCRQESVAKDFITSYACLNNYEEDFGDSLGYFVMRQDEFFTKAQSSETLMKKYDWIRDNLFHGKEFKEEDLKRIFVQ